MNFDDPAARARAGLAAKGRKGSTLIEAPFDATRSHHRRQRRTERHARRLTPGGLTLIDGRCPIAHGLVSTRLELAELLNQLALEAMNQAPARSGGCRQAGR